jgi:hypothetical protein
MSVDLRGSNHVVQSCVNIVMESCLFAFVFNTFPLSWGMKQHNRYDDKTVSWTTEKLIYSWQGQGDFLFSTTCTPSGIYPVPPRAPSPGVKWSVLEADYSCLVPRLRTTGAIPPLPPMPKCLTRTRRYH